MRPMFSKEDLSVQDLATGVQNANNNICKHVVRTPVIRLPWLDSEEREVWAKLECHQHTGSFKYRGAYNALSRTKTNKIITASAGNHALATAAAGRRLGKDVHLIAPITASELKVNRMMADAEVTLLGQDLHEATLMAISLAQKSAIQTADETETLYYVSPYDNVDVAAGAGTVMLEAEEDHGVFDTVVVPLGGGGLAAGVGAWCAHNSPRTNVVCTHPEIFGRKFAKSEPIASQLVSPTAVSYSDGLAVQLARETPFARILQETIRDVVQVTEAETAVAISIALRMQSLLIEGSAATTIAALLKPEAPETRHIKGRVLLLLTGGNIASSSLARSLVSEVSDAPLRQAIGLRNILPSVDRCGSTKLPVEDVGEQKLDASKEKASDSGDGARALADDTTSSLEQWQVFSDRLQAMIKATAEQMQEKDELSARLCLEQDPWCKDVYNELQQVLYRRAKEFEAAVKTPPSSCQESQVPKFWVMEERYRILLQQHSAVACLFDRASAANDQSLRDWFRDFDSQSATVCNYDRYGSSRLRATEQVLAKALALGDTSGTELLLTSSGMAAYQVVQHFLLQSIGDKGNFVLPPYVYFEGMEQLQAFDFVTVTHAPTFDAQDIIATAEAVDAKVVFLDAVANVVDLPATDVRDFCRTVAHRPGWGDRIVVMDGTTASGAMPVFDWMQGRHAPTLLYFESASKYLQFGMDLQMGGLVVYPSRLDAAMRTIRRNTGGVMYSRGLSLLPPLDRAAYQRRMAQLSRNAEVLRDGIAAAASDLVHVRFPSEWKRFGWRHGGALVTVRFLRDGLNNKDGLEACIDLVLAGAKAKGLAVTKGVSFGFSTTRISSASSMAKDSDPFLRLSVGVDLETRQDLLEVMVAAIRRYADTF
ncbi:pyridoxal-5'-phosphate-dependent protein beta subunit [Pyricularia oryzae 70-15]|uniref:Pyridoxal-5'-phosphate-dependent protein beta subunit n=2 Tax=Pyricularia oryzae TaxID=318829 RepID=G4NJZ5_PYRO7|nr:pyridoxal-5'-phosphate-dependent protein beta subunit [Pyricularia oryzae 70-15]EHA45763.1 pyridoxal-5'-phosphate-dependent protein beta subunit [Pyricularia oryzae 70-15]KAI7915691.1 pyridoxal-5' [Pyricularia oryzae]KAI7915847.1 pyridoxal-5' [Pyricularia oryzae]